MSRPLAGQAELGMGPLDRGRSRYSQKNYPGALEAFNEAVRISTGYLLVTALDHRAAAYEKMNRLQSALQDSKQMIDLHPELAKGYLRCAKVLQLKGENKLAMKIYERGLNKVKIGTDDDRVKLQSFYTKFRQSQDPGKSLDPLEFLPVELIEMIFCNLSMRDRVICLVVSKPWKRLLDSSYKLWTTFDTTHTRRPISQTSLKSHLKRSNYAVDKAIINMRAKFDITRMKYLIRTCHKLRHLELTGSGFIGDSLTAALPLARGLETLIVSAGVEIRFTDVQKSLSICRATLVETSFLDIVETQLVSKWEKLPRLNTLQLRFQKATLLNLDGLGESFANIRSLTVCKWHNPTISGLVDLTGLTNLHDLALIDTYITFFRELPLTIKRLNFSKSIIDIQSQDDSSYRLPLLERLDCSKALIFPSFLKAITHESIKVGNFKQLYMGGRLMRPSIVGDEYPPSSTVEELSLASLPMKEEALINITNLYPNLRWLDVSETKVTGVAVKHFINVGIKWLGLNECTEVSSDAVEFARGKGVEVAFMFPSRSAAFKSSFRGSSWRGAF